MPSLGQFIRGNRDAIDDYVSSRLNFVPKQASCDCPKCGTDHYHDDNRRFNDEQRRQWVLNDEGLYNWARESGVVGI